MEALLRAHVSNHLIVEQWLGISLLWGVVAWGRLLDRLPAGLTRRLLLAADAIARWRPHWADVIIVAGRPRW